MKTNNLLQGMIYKPLRKIFCLFLVCHGTSIKETITAAIIPNAWSALNVGAPHCKGYGMLILREWKVTWKCKTWMLKLVNVTWGSLQTILMKIWDCHGLSDSWSGWQVLCACMHHLLWGCGHIPIQERCTSEVRTSPKQEYDEYSRAWDTGKAQQRV